MAGIATPTEASGVGVFCAILMTVLHGRFSPGMLIDAARRTVATTSMVLFLMIGATCFSAVFKGLGNLASLVQQAQQMGGRIKQIGEELKQRRVEGTAGGGLVATDQSW